MRLLYVNDSAGSVSDAGSDNEGCECDITTHISLRRNLGWCMHVANAVKRSASLQGQPLCTMQTLHSVKAVLPLALLVQLTHLST